MTLDQLRIFVAVAEREHVTRAAEALNLTQSAASGAIAALEREFATRLFHRVGRGIALTEAGTMFLSEARAVLSRAAAATAAMREVSSLARGHLAIKASQTIANHVLPVRLVAFRRAYPGSQPGGLDRQFRRCRRGDRRGQGRTRLRRRTGRTP
jgi:transcriptional regulator, LysR family